MKLNKANKIVNDFTAEKSTIVLTTKSFKVIISILILGIMTILGISYKFKLSLDEKINNLSDTMKTQYKELLQTILTLDEKKVQVNTFKNYEQDGDIKVLLDRTNTKYIQYNSGNDRRPDDLDNFIPN